MILENPKRIPISPPPTTATRDRPPHRHRDLNRHDASFTWVLANRRSKMILIPFAYASRPRTPAFTSLLYRTFIYLEQNGNFRAEPLSYRLFRPQGSKTFDTIRCKYEAHNSNRICPQGQGPEVAAPPPGVIDAAWGQKLECAETQAERHSAAPPKLASS